MTSCTNGNCGSKTCGFGKKKKSAFGSGADAFFSQPFTGNASLQKMGECLQSGVYSNVTPLSRFGSKMGKGPMKIGKSKK